MAIRTRPQEPVLCTIWLCCSKENFMSYTNLHIHGPMRHICILPVSLLNLFVCSLLLCAPILYFNTDKFSKLISLYFFYFCCQKMGWINNDMMRPITSSPSKLLIYIKFLICIGYVVRKKNTPIQWQFLSARFFIVIWTSLHTHNVVDHVV